MGLLQLDEGCSGDVHNNEGCRSAVCWDVEKYSPVVRCVTGICIITCQRVEILLRFPESRVAPEVDFIDP